MSSNAVGEKSIVLIRQGLLVWWVALALGWASAAVAGPAEELINAASRGDAAAVQALLAKGAGVNAKDDVGATALIDASYNGHLEVVQALLAKGAEIDAKMNDGATALMLASQYGHLDVVQALLAKGADVNANAAINGATALMLAASVQGHLDVVPARITAMRHAGENREVPALRVEKLQVPARPIIGPGIVGEEIGGVKTQRPADQHQPSRSGWGRLPVAHGLQKRKGDGDAGRTQESPAVERLDGHGGSRGCLDVSKLSYHTVREWRRKIKTLAVSRLSDFWRYLSPS